MTNRGQGEWSPGEIPAPGERKKAGTQGIHICTKQCNREGKSKDGGIKLGAEVFAFEIL